MKSRISGLYAVTPDIADTPALLAKVEAALAGGARLLQYRNKTANAALRLTQGRALLALCWEYQVPLIINDHLDLALALDAAWPAPRRRRRLARGSARAGWVPARSSAPPVTAASKTRWTPRSAGADYVAFGRFFPSTVKPSAVRAPLDLLREAKQRLSVPVVAIGGITLDNAPQLIAAGADGVAVISALFGAPDVKLAARGFSALFPRREPHSVHP